MPSLSLSFQGLRRKLSALSLSSPTRDRRNDAIEERASPTRPKPGASTTSFNTASTPSSPTTTTTTSSAARRQPSKPHLKLPTASMTSFNTSVPSSPTSAVSRRTNASEHPWREARLSARAVPASVVHSFTPVPRPKKRTTFNDLPYEILECIFSYLVGDPTRADAVRYRTDNMADPKSRCAHSWSLECCTRVCRVWRSVAWPILASTFAVINKDDVRVLARASAQRRAMIRHLVVSIPALERLYVLLSILALSSQYPLAKLEEMSGVQSLALRHLSSSSPTEKPVIAGLPFTQLSSLRRLTIFRPSNETSTMTGDAVLPGFTSFFLSSVQRLLSDAADSLERLVMRDPRGNWLSLSEHAREEDGETILPRPLTALRDVKWDIVLPLPALRDLVIRVGTPSLRCLTYGSLDAAPPILDSLTHLRLRSAAVLSATTPALPSDLTVLHLLPPDGLSAAQISSLANCISGLDSLRDLRIAVAEWGPPSSSHNVGTTYPNQAVERRLLASLPTSLRIFELRQTPPSSSDEDDDGAASFPSSPVALSSSTVHLGLPSTSLARLDSLRVLSLIVVPPIHSIVLKSASKSLCASHALPGLARSKESKAERRAHEWHYPYARSLLATLPNLREVHMSCSPSSPEVLECVWGRPDWYEDGDGDDDGGDAGVEMDWMDVGTRTRLWESACW
ncbi:hypothetical protein EXIGLDRAFT_721545 [Exidia glandulosa HHB12029]|uniref:F-box domain-containing protein n=1 Tax=Exidia glandulosa HHB12029 TaxID=1314781 RepID=A0A165FN63_EXIGL|nr:hypothetical protein EXIGLDRAFT_721545 [Exidia glandulosa HHB12029]